MYTMKVLYCCVIISLIYIHGVVLLDPTDEVTEGEAEEIEQELEEVNKVKEEEWKEKEKEAPITHLTRNQEEWFNSLDTTPDNIMYKRSSLPRAVRREYRTLTDEERERYHRAVRTLKNSYIDGVSVYSLLVEVHHPTMSPAAHFGVAFYPFHREYLTRYETALRRIDPTVALPYWDSTLDRHLPDPSQSILWSNRFMGTNKGIVTAGPFVKWKTIPQCYNSTSTTMLERDVGIRHNFTFLLDEFMLNGAMNHTSYYSFSRPPVFEIQHGGPHEFVGGHMNDIACSPTDPMFFMHHCFVDMIWEKMRQNSQQTSLSEYPECTSDNCTNIGGNEHKADAPMKPFRHPKTGEYLENQDGMSPYYTDSVYTYYKRSYQCQEDADCGLYLFCHKRRCKSKVMSGGNCEGLPVSPSPCETGLCDGHLCVDE